MISKRPAYVVLDTSVLRQDFHWTGQMAVLAAAASACGATICVPRVCQSELVSLFRRELAACRKPLRRCSLLLQRELVAEEEIEHAVQDYSETVATRCSASGTLTLESPRVEASELSEWITLGRRPFNSGSDAGIRDYLIWKSVVGLASRVGSPVAFVSRDNDFAEIEGSVARLHRDLVADLQSVDVGPTRVVLFQMMGDLIENFISGLSDAFRTVLDQEPDISDRLRREILRELLNNYEESIYAPEEGEYEPRIYDIAPEFEILGIRKLKRWQYAITGRATYNPRWHYGDPLAHALQNECQAKVQFVVDKNLDVIAASVLDSWETNPEKFTDRMKLEGNL